MEIQASSGFVWVVLGSEFYYVVVAHNVPEWYGASGLPAGWVIDAQTGIISGMPLESGDFEVSLVASNRYGLGTGSLILRISPPVVAWGAGTNNTDSYRNYGQSQVPNGLSNVVAIAAGASHSLALTFEGRVVAWGNNYYGQTNVPSGLRNVVAIAAGGEHSLALTADGRVYAWGFANQAMVVPFGLRNVVAIAAGGDHSLALTVEGQVVAWGYTTDVPVGLSNVVAIAVGRFHNLALTAEGRVVSWGHNDYAQTNVPGGLSNVVAIAAGEGHSLALTAQGQVMAWGANWLGQTDVPVGLSNVVAIAAGGEHSLALTAEGRVVAWGNYDRGQSIVPSGSCNVVAIAAGGEHSLALLQQPTVPTPGLELSRGLPGLELRAYGVLGISCQLLRASQLPGPWLPSEPVTFTNHVQWLHAPDASAPAQFFRLLRK